MHSGGKDYLVLTPPLLDRLRDNEKDVEVIRVDLLEDGEHCDAFWAADAVEVTYWKLMGPSHIRALHRALTLTPSIFLQRISRRPANAKGRPMACKPRRPSFFGAAQVEPVRLPPRRSTRRSGRRTLHRARVRTATLMDTGAFHRLPTDSSWRGLERRYRSERQGRPYT